MAKEKKVEKRDVAGRKPSYKDLLTNLLISVVNQKIEASQDIQRRMKELDEKKQKRFPEKVSSFIIERARAYWELQGSKNGAIMIEDSIVFGWIDDFFDDLEEHLKEPEKPKKTKAKGTETKTLSGNQTIEFIAEEGFFGIEVQYSKKEKLSKENFIEKIKKLHGNKKNYEFNWEDGKVTVKITDKKEKKEVAAKEETNKTNNKEDKVDNEEELSEEETDTDDEISEEDTEETEKETEEDDENEEDEEEDIDEREEEDEEGDLFL